MPVATQRSEVPLKELAWVSLGTILGTRLTAANEAIWTSAIAAEAERLKGALGLREAALEVRRVGSALEVRAIGVAGTITLGQTTIDIIPKYESGSSDDRWHMSIFSLLERANRRSFTYARAAKLAPRAGSFVDHMAMAYLDAVARGFSSEPIHSYRVVEERRPFLQGRLNISRQLNDVIARPHILTCDVDQLDTNNGYNQLLDWAAWRLSKSVHDSSLRQRLSQVRARILADSPRFDRPAIVPSNPPPQYRAWVDALDIARMVAATQTHGQARGAASGYGLVLGMERLFERFVQESLREAIAILPIGTTVRPQFSSLYARPKEPLGKRLFSRPDNVVLADRKPVLVVDAKYKRLVDADERAVARPNNADVYELVAAMTAHGCKAGLLVYPKIQGDAQLDDGRIHTWEIGPVGSGMLASAVAVDISSLRGRVDVLALDQVLGQHLRAAMLGSLLAA
jgi:5-methylcytosine-specific restriction enzyme subunit McrC